MSLFGFFWAPLLRGVEITAVFWWFFSPRSRSNFLGFGQSALLRP